MPPSRPRVEPAIETDAPETKQPQPARLNVQLDPSVWSDLPEATQADLLWFHGYAIAQNFTWDEASEALGYDRSTVFRVLKGEYAGSWDNVVRAIRSYKKIAEARSTIQVEKFVETPSSKLIFAAINYAVAANKIAIIYSESRQGKSITGMEWFRRNNHGRTTFVSVPASGGVRGLLVKIAKACGIGPQSNTEELRARVFRAFNRNRILILDEAHRLLPGTKGGNPVMLEVMRELHDETGCALVLLATQRFDNALRSGEYMFEQLIGRAKQTRLPKKSAAADVLPIIEQYLKPSDKLLATLIDIANKPGRLAVMVDMLRDGSRYAAKQKTKLAESHIWTAISVAKQLEGGTL